MPEPLAENLTDLSESIKVNKSDFGIAVDPDVDRLVFFWWKRDNIGRRIHSSILLRLCSVEK